MKKSPETPRSQIGGDYATLVQAGRDVNLFVKKSPPNIKLVRLTVSDDTSQQGLRQNINVILKNNGETTAFMLEGQIICEASEEVRDPVVGHPSLSVADWTYDADLTLKNPVFPGQHSIAPNEVINFNVMAGRSEGGDNVTVYKVIMRFRFDEGDLLETDYFHLLLAGPMIMNGRYVAYGPTAKEWGRGMADNVRQLDKIGFDFRPFISEKSIEHVKNAAPDLFD